MKVYLIPKNDFQESCGMLVVNLDRLTTSLHKMVRLENYEEGIAHFLEHKLFELENGQDVSELFTNACATAMLYNF